MSLREYVAHQVETLGENELSAVADYVAFLKFRARMAMDDARLASLYTEFAEEDLELAEAGMDDYTVALLREDSQ